MQDLLSKVETFLEAERFTVNKRRDLVVGTRRTIAEDQEYIYVWVPVDYDPATFRSREAEYLSRFKEAADHSPSAPKFMVVPTAEGLSREFREGVRQWYRVNVRTPVQFFDTDFKWDISYQAASAAKELKNKGEARAKLRVPQPFVLHNTGEHGADLFETLRACLANPTAQQKSIHVVTGPAGIGKSYLFDVLFAQLHEAFWDYKLRGGPAAPRPLPLIPDYIPLADGLTIRSLLAAYLQTDFARPLRTETFEWMMTNGFGVWMLDGLDEVVSQDPSFFDYLLELYTLPNAPCRPTVIICVRDALLATNEAFREFCEDYTAAVEIYRLDKWEAPSKRRFAQMALQGSAEPFMAVLRERPSLNDLASTPYYCDLLAQEYKAGKLQEDYSEESLVERSLENFVERDYGKGFIRKELVSFKDICAFLEATATEDFEGGFRGVSTSLAKEWACMVLPSGLSNEEWERLSDQMVNLCVYSEASPGYIRFSQEILEQFLLGRKLVSLFKNREQSDAFVRELAHGELPADWLTIRLLADYIRRTEGFGQLKNLVFQATAYPTAFRNVVKIASLCAAETTLKDFPFEGQNISGILFNGFDFQGASFARCNLTDTVFERCDLRGANFIEATMKNTGFLSLPSNGLEKAKIGDLTKFFSVRVDRKKVVSSHIEAREWFGDRTGEHLVAVEPCNAAVQLRYFFNKFVRPDGTARRSWLQRRAMLAGRALHSSPESVLSAAIRHGYFREEERYRDRIHRPEGGLYSSVPRNSF